VVCRKFYKTPAGKLRAKLLRSAGVNFSNKSLEYYLLLLDEVKFEDQVVRVSATYFNQLKQLTYMVAQLMPINDSTRKIAFLKDVEKNIESLNPIFMNSFDSLAEEFKKQESDKERSKLVTKSTVSELSKLMVDTNTKEPIRYGSFVDIINKVRGIVDNTDRKAGTD
jgi:hypothetical protein